MSDLADYDADPADTEYTPEMAHAAAARGAAWLDEKCPGWPERIDIEALRLSDATYCVLGQTATCLLGEPQQDDYDDDDAGYWRVMNSDMWRGEGLGAPYVGFDLPFISGVQRRDAAYEMLTIAWKELIRERLAVPE